MKPYIYPLAAALLASSFLNGANPAAAAAVANPASEKHADYGATIETMAAAIDRQYPIEATAHKLAAALRSAAKDPAFLAMDEANFLEAINTVMWDVAHDLHLRVRTSAATEARTKAGGGKAVPRMRRVVRTPGGSGAIGNTSISAEMLNVNTGLITITSPIYNNVALFTEKLSAVSSAENIIIDVRACPGGTVPGVQYFTSQFFGERTHLSSRISRESDVPQKLWTVETEIGDEFADKNIYVLTSKRTASGAEALSYALKNTDRATLVGEKTAGAGNAGAYIGVGNGLLMFLPISQTISPKTGKPWEAKGVVPHIDASAEAALDAALGAIKDKA